MIKVPLINSHEEPLICFALKVHKVYGSSYPEGLAQIQATLAKSAPSLIPHRTGELWTSGRFWGWPAHVEDIAGLSREHPSVLFELSGKGDSPDDVWVKYFFKGEMQECLPKLVIPSLSWHAFGGCQVVRTIAAQKRGESTRSLLERAEDFRGGSFDEDVLRDLLRDSLSVTPAERGALRDLLQGYLYQLLHADKVIQRMVDLLKRGELALAAYREARDERGFGASDPLRKVACTSSAYAFHFAYDVDEGPRDDTRAAACGTPAMAYQYALSVDKSPREDTRAAASKNPECAFLYARDVDKRSLGITRDGACEKPEFAYSYALKVDKGPSYETRAAACGHWLYAFHYARDVDKAPRDDTRAAASVLDETGRCYTKWEHSLCL